MARTTPRMRFVAAALLVVAATAPTLVGTPAAAEVVEHCAIAAHRGDWSTATENGIPAMRSAIDKGADYLEADLRLTSDEQFVLMHDMGVRATTNGSGRVAAKTLRQIKRLRLDDGSQVPTLAELLEAAAPSGVHLLIDVKVMGDRSTYRDLARQLRAFGPERVRVTSRSTDHLDTLRAIAPGLHQGIITSQLLTPDQVAPYDAVVLNFNAMTVEWLDSMPYPVYAWTLNDEEAWNRSEAYRLAAVITDAPWDFMEWRQVGCLTPPA